jgi:hypothetical protein
VRTAFILGLLVAIAGAVTYAIVFGPEHGLSVPTGTVVEGTTKAAAQEKSAPSSVVTACQNIGSPDTPEDSGQEPPLPGVTGSCERLGAGSETCKACLSMHRKDCGGRTKSSSAFPTYDWATIPERELPRAVAEVSKAVAVVKARTDAKLEKDKAAVQKIYDTGTCSDTQSYLRERIKELEQPDLQTTKDTIERTAVCLREKHRVLTKLMLDDLNPVLYERIRVLGDAAIDMAILARDLGTSTAKASQKLTELRKHNARCGS